MASLVYFLAANTCTSLHSPGPWVSAKSKKVAYCGRFGALGTKLNSKMALRRHGWFFSRFSSILQG